MDCVPAVLVRADWAALAGWAAVAVNIIIGGYFGAVFQRRQARAAQALAEHNRSADVREIAEAVVLTMDVLLATGPWWDTDAPVLRKLGEIDQQVRVVENLLAQRVANAALLRVLVDAHASVAGLQSVLREIASLDHDKSKQAMARGWAWSGAVYNAGRWRRIRSAAEAFLA